MGTAKHILGLDQALRHTGYAVLSNGEIIDSGVIETVAKQEYLFRLHTIVSRVEHLIETYDITTVFLEEVFAHGKGAWKNLLEVKILLEMLCYEKDIPCHILSPLLNRKNSWRKALGLTSSDKKVWQQIIGERNEHIADAIGIVKAGYKLHN